MQWNGNECAIHMQGKWNANANVMWMQCECNANVIQMQCERNVQVQYECNVNRIS